MSNVPELPPKLSDLIVEACVSFSHLLDRGGNMCNEKIAFFIRLARARGRLSGKLTPEEGEQMIIVANRLEEQESGD